MKVLHVTHYPKGGIITVILNQCRYSQSRDVRYAIALFAGFDEDLDKVAREHHIPIYFIGLHKGFLFARLLRYFAVIRRFAPDVIHTHSYLPRVFTAILVALGVVRTRRAVATFHNDYPYFRDRSIRSVFKRMTEKIAIKVVKPTAVCVSNGVADAVGSLYHPVGGTVVVNNGVYLSKRRDHASWGSRCGDCIVVTIGRLASQKNYGFLLDCWAEVLKKHQTGSLWFIGDGEERAGLEARAKALNIAASVRFLGWQSNVNTFLDQATIFVLSSNYEGFPMAILEAQSRGVPVIATKVSGVGEIIESGVNGIIVDKDDKPAMVDALLALRDDLEMRDRLGKEGQSSVYAKFSIARYIQNVESLYHQQSTALS